MHACGTTGLHYCCSLFPWCFKTIARDLDHAFDAPILSCFVLVSVIESSVRLISFVTSSTGKASLQIPLYWLGRSGLHWNHLFRVWSHGAHGHFEHTRGYFAHVCDLLVIFGAWRVRSIPIQRISVAVWVSSLARRHAVLPPRDRCIVN